jgi:hypothetical protein
MAPWWKNNEKNEIFSRLLRLYPAYDVVLGPYLRKDNRKHVILNKSNVNWKRGKLKTISWPKAKMEAFIGRKLKEWETVDHIDEDKTNNKISNLQILSRKDNAKKSMDQPHRKRKISSFTCSICSSVFSIPESTYQRNQIRLGKAGPFCSKSCAGIYSTT